MGRLKYLLLGILAIILSGCGQTVVETLNVPAGPGLNGAGAGRTVVILPFADYSYANNLAGAYRRNLAITETLTDRLVANGFGLPIQEDVVRYLIDKKIISMAAYEDVTSPTIVNELQAEWSEEIKADLRKYLNEQPLNGKNKLSESPGTHGLDRRTVSMIGRTFNADYIVRGRILEFKTRQENTWAPWKRGFLPMVTGASGRMLLGFAESDNYDTLNQMVGGTVAGGATGFAVNTPYSPSNTLIGNVASNTVVWGVGGALAGNLAKHSGKVDQAVVQLRVWVQEAASGNVVWTNRVDVKVSPESVLADNQYDMLFDKAINKGISTLIDDFVSYGL